MASDAEGVVAILEKQRQSPHRSLSRTDLTGPLGRLVLDLGRFAEASADPVVVYLRFKRKDGGAPSHEFLGTFLGNKRIPFNYLTIPCMAYQIKSTAIL